MAIDRRSFLRGASACAVAAAVPLPALAAFEVEVETILPMTFPMPPIFEGSIGAYQGVIIRHERIPIDMNAACRQTLKGWIGKRSASPVMSADMVEEAKRLAVICHPRGYGTITETVLEGAWVNGD